MAKEGKLYCEICGSHSYGSKICHSDNHSGQFILVKSVFSAPDYR